MEHGKLWTYDKGCRCKACVENRRLYNRLYRLKNLTKYKADKKAFRQKRIEIAKQKLGGKCVVCGSTENLEFDHIKRDRKYTITQAVSLSQERLDEELKKCQLLCHECHMNKTVAERNRLRVTPENMLKRKHGNLTTYRIGCRCEECRSRHALYLKQYRTKKSVLIQ